MGKTFETPKGTRDFLPEEMRVRSAVFSRLSRAFQLFGFEELDTPVFEYLEALTLKAGPAAEREIYSFEDKGGRKLGLRFDLTSSTGRVAAAHPELKRPIYRYQIGKVWRYDRPAAGRYREFYQADADIIGSYSMDCEVDLLLLSTSILRTFGLHVYTLPINHRKLLEAQIRRAGITLEKKADALRALDKYDKIGRDGVLTEAAGYGIEGQSFERFLELTSIDSLSTLQSELQGDAEGEKAIAELSYIFERAKTLHFADHLVFDPKLARGLDYYTGPIFEAKAEVQGKLLSFGGGGRYDDLIGLYGGMPQGAVGFSFGVERLIALLLEQKAEIAGQVPRPILVAPLGGNCSAQAEQVAMALREQGISARIGLSATSPSKHLQYAESTRLDWVIFVGENEVKEGRYPLRQLATRTEHKLTLAELLAHLQTALPSR